MSAIVHHPAFKAYQAAVLRREEEWESVRAFAQETPLEALIKAQRDKHEVKQLQALVHVKEEERTREASRREAAERRVEELEVLLGLQTSHSAQEDQPMAPPATPAPSPTVVRPVPMGVQASVSHLFIYEEFVSTPLVVRLGPVYFGGRWPGQPSLHECEHGVLKRNGVSAAWVKEKKNLFYKRLLLMGAGVEVSKLRAAKAQEPWTLSMGMDVVHDLEAGYRDRFECSEARLEAHVKKIKKVGQWAALDAECRIWGGRGGGD